MAKWKEFTLNEHRATAGELINLSVYKHPHEVDEPKPRWVVTLRFGQVLVKTLPGDYKNPKKAKRAAETEANRLLATALMDINLIELQQIGGLGKIYGR